MATSTALGYGDLPGLLTLLKGDEKHDPSAYSTLDVIWVLYDRVLRVNPARPDDPDRDRFLLSKGHGPAAFYAVLAAKGFFPVETLGGYGGFASPLGHHPDRVLVPGVEISSGSLGHGLGLAVGVALALGIQGRQEPRVVCLLGDAELEEGSNFEAIQLAGRLAIGRLTTVVIDNHSSAYGWPGGIERRFELEDWSATTVSGRDHEAIEAAFAAATGNRPHVVVADVQRRER
jgi:transketolase